MARPQRRTHAAHGTLTRYNAGCSCLACCDARNAYAAEYKADSGPRWVDVAEVRAHIHRLYAAGFSRGAIAAASGVPRGTIRIIDGTSKASQSNGAKRHTTRVKRENAEAILSVDAVLPGHYHGLIPAAPSRRLVERLIERVGVTELARNVGKSKAWVWQIRLPEDHPKGMRQIRARTAAAIEEYARSLGVYRSDNGPAEWVLDADEFDRLVAVYGYSPVSIVEAAGASYKSYMQTRCGRPVSLSTAERIARALGVRVESVFKKRKGVAA